MAEPDAWPCVDLRLRAALRRGALLERAHEGSQEHSAIRESPGQGFADSRRSSHSGIDLLVHACFWSLSRCAVKCEARLC